jgi:hypothetical protein
VVLRRGGGVDSRGRGGGAGLGQGSAVVVRQGGGGGGGVEQGGVAWRACGVCLACVTDSGPGSIPRREPRSRALDEAPSEPHTSVAATYERRPDFFKNGCKSSPRAKIQGSRRSLRAGPTHRRSPHGPHGQSFAESQDPGLSAKLPSGPHMHRRPLPDAREATEILKKM